MAERMPVEIHLDPVHTGRGKIVLGGLDISRAVRAVRFHSEAGEVTRLELELPAIPINLAGNAEAMLSATVDGARISRPIRGRLLGLLVAIHEELRCGARPATEEPKDA